MSAIRTMAKFGVEVGVKLGCVAAGVVAAATVLAGGDAATAKRRGAIAFAAILAVSTVTYTALGTQTTAEHIEYVRSGAISADP